MQGVAFRTRRTSLNRLKRKGILYVAGGRDMIASMFISIRVLRDVLHSKLPIEVVFSGEQELDRRNQEFLEVCRVDLQWHFAAQRPVWIAGLACKQDRLQEYSSRLKDGF